MRSESIRLAEQRDAARLLNGKLLRALGFNPSDQELTTDQVLDYIGGLMAGLPSPSHQSVSKAMVVRLTMAVRTKVPLLDLIADLVVEMPDWQWLPGMAVKGSAVGRIVSEAEDLHQNGAAVVASHGGLTQSLRSVSLVGVSPDLTDPATLGCMRACGGLVAELAEVLDGGAK